MLKSGLYSNEIAIVHAIKKKTERGNPLCGRDLEKASTWKRLNALQQNKRIVVYGTGDMFAYFCAFYSKRYNIEYAVDKKVHSGNVMEKNGIPVYPIAKLFSEASPEELVVCITPVYGIDEIYDDLQQAGIRHCVSLLAMEAHRFKIKAKVLWSRLSKAYTLEYQMQRKVEKLYEALRVSNEILRSKDSSQDKRMDGIQQRQTERYGFLLHTNRVVNALIDILNDEMLKEELKKDQIRYYFKEIKKNEYYLDFDRPKTYNEKMQAMMMYDHNPLYSVLNDKYLLKNYITEKIGKEYVVPLLGVWDDPREIDFSVLPDRFALKATNGGDSTRVILVKDKSRAELNTIITQMCYWKDMCQNVYYANFNQVYKNMKQRFIAEELLDTDDLECIDFGVHCFHGEPKYIMILDKNKKRIKFYDTDWKLQDFVFELPFYEYDVPKPWCLDELLALSRKLSEPFQHVRVDFMVLKDRFYIGEMTFTTFGGFGRFDPPEADLEWGDCWGEMEFYHPDEG